MGHGGCQFDHLQYFPRSRWRSLTSLTSLTSLPGGLTDTSLPLSQYSVLSRHSAVSSNTLNIPQLSVSTVYRWDQLARVIYHLYQKYL